MPDVVPIDPTRPLSVTVDFQSIHHAGFRLSMRTPGGQWVLIKKGHRDTTVPLAAVPQGTLLRYEFLFFESPDPFRAILVFRQGGQILPDGVVAVEADPADLFVAGEVELQ